MSATTVTLPPRIARRIEKRAGESGRSSDDMVGFVDRDGTEYCE